MEHCVSIITVPSKAEEEKGDSKECGDHMSERRACMVRTEAETKPEGSNEGKQLAGQEVHLKGSQRGKV